MSSFGTVGESELLVINLIFAVYLMHILRGLLGSSHVRPNQFLDASAKLRNSTITFVMSVRLYILQEHLGYQ
jgi:hypothetical protein